MGDTISEMANLEPRIHVFYCCRIPGSGDQERQQIEKEWGMKVKCFPLPCSGRFEQRHVLLSLEGGSDAAYIITCPEGQCRYFDGNRQARKRVEYTKELLSEVGIEPDRVAVYVAEPTGTLQDYVKHLRAKACDLPPLRTSKDRG